MAPLTAPKGWPLGHMAPYPVHKLWWPLLQRQDTHLHSQPLRTPTWPFSQWTPALSGLISSEESHPPCQAFSCFEEGVEGFYSILGVRWGITPSLQLTPAFRLELFTYLSIFWHLGIQIPQVPYLEPTLGYILLIFSFNFKLTFNNYKLTYFKACWKGYFVISECKII